MSNGFSSNYQIDVDDDDLDYELEMDIDEEKLLEEEDTPDTHTGLSWTKAVPTQPTQPFVPPVIRLTNVECPSTIVTFDTIPDISPIKPANVAAEPENTTETTFGFEHVKSALIDESFIASIDASARKSPQRQSVIHPTEMKQTDKRDVTSSQSSTSSSLSSTTPKKNESKKKGTGNGRRKLLQRNGMLNISAESNRRVVVPSLLAINTMGPALNGLSTVDHRMDRSDHVPSNAPTKKNPFIIQAQSIGTDAVSRTVWVDPNFGGFPKRNIVNLKFSNRNASRTDSNDLRRSLVKRKLVTISNGEEAKIELPQSIAVNDDMSDEDRRYMAKIEMQKLKRKEYLQLKAHRNQGWKFDSL